LFNCLPEWMAGLLKGHRVKSNDALKRWTPLILWVAFIFIMSSIPDLPGDYRALPAGTDKVAHFVEYFVLALLLHRGIRRDGVKRMELVLISLVVIGFAIGGLDELYQNLVPGRDSSVADLAADLIGITAGALTIYYNQRRRARSEG
jgi:VanZ family protein